MSQYSYYLLTIPYNSFCSAFYFLIHLSIVEGYFSENDLKIHSMCLWNIFGTQRRFQSECSDDVLKDISKDMKCLGKSKLVQVLVRITFSLVGAVRRPGMSIHKNTLFGTNISYIQHVHETKDSLMSIKIHVYKHKSFGILTFSIIFILLLPLYMCIDIRKVFCTCMDRISI